MSQEFILPEIPIIMKPSDYNPAHIVQTSHNILHLNSKLEVVSNDFQAFGFGDLATDYTTSLLPVPIICASLGILAVVMLQLFLFLRICYKQLRFLPDIKIAGRKSLTLIKYAIDPRFLKFYKILIIATIIILDEILVFGSFYLSQGVSTAQNDIDGLKDNITLLINEGDLLNSYGLTLQTYLYNASAIEPTCTDATQLANNIDIYFEPYINQYLDYITPLPQKCNDANANMYKWGVHYKNSSVWAIYSMYFILVGLFIIGLKFRNQIICRISVAVGEICCFLLFILIAVEMVLVMGMSDYCMNPLSNTYGLIPSDIYNITSYYIQCEGSNPLYPPLNELYGFTNQYFVDVQQLYQSSPDCNGNMYLQKSLQELQIMNSTIHNLNWLGYCPPLQSQVSDVLENGLCDLTFQGIYVVWIGQYVTTAFVFGVIVIIAYLYQYFGDDILLDAMLQGDNDDVDGEEVDEEAGKGGGDVDGNNNEDGVEKKDEAVVYNSDTKNGETNEAKRVSNRRKSTKMDDVITYENSAYQPPTNNNNPTTAAAAVNIAIPPTMPGSLPKQLSTSWNSDEGHHRVESVLLSRDGPSVVARSASSSNQSSSSFNIRNPLVRYNNNPLGNGEEGSATNNNNNREISESFSGSRMTSKSSIVSTFELESS